jgi:hypothetical protein
MDEAAAVKNEQEILVPGGHGAAFAASVGQLV